MSQIFVSSWVESLPRNIKSTLTRKVIWAGKKPMNFYNEDSIEIYDSFDKRSKEDSYFTFPIENKNIFQGSFSRKRII